MRTRYKVVQSLIYKLIVKSGIKEKIGRGDKNLFMYLKINYKIKLDIKKLIEKKILQFFLINEIETTITIMCEKLDDKELFCKKSVAPSPIN